jgi:phosphoribosylaminoimidazole carboxylase PurE protein
MTARVEGGAGARVAIIMGSDSDLPEMKGAAEALDVLQVPYEMSVVSAHRTPTEMAEFAEAAASRGICVIIAGAGGAAHLPGMVAAHTPIPVIGVPVPVGHMNGIDALLSIVQMPKGVPVGSVAIGASYNAGLLAAQIVAFGGKDADRQLAGRIEAFKEDMRRSVLAKQI